MPERLRADGLACGKGISVMPKPTQAEEAAFMRDPSRWPNYGICPIVHRGNHHQPPRVGILVVDGDDRIMFVPDANMWGLKDAIDKIANAKPADIDTLVAEGWVVD